MSLIYTKQDILKSEALYELEVAEAAQFAVSTHRHVILLAGASCAGKTTTSKKLAEAVNALGYTTEVVSLDDFYTSPEHKEGEKIDYESPESLDLPLLESSFKAILAGDPIELPVFDFKVRKRAEYTRHIDTDDNTFVIFEGLHALNPEITAACKPDDTCRVYLTCESEDYDAKLLRRLVRDYYHRASSPEFTLFLWKSVNEGERKYILPYRSLADRIVHSHFGYEPDAFRDEGLSILSSIGEDSPYYNEASRLTELLSGATQLDVSLIPEYSLMREFLPEKDTK